MVLEERDEDVIYYEIASFQKEEELLIFIQNFCVTLSENKGKNWGMFLGLCYFQEFLTVFGTNHNYSSTSCTDSSRYATIFFQSLINTNCSTSG